MSTRDKTLGPVGQSLCTVFLATVSCAMLASAQQNPPAINLPASVQDNGTAEPTNAQPLTSTTHILAGRSWVFTSALRIKRVSVADPSVADVIVISPTELLIDGKSPGNVSVVLWDEDDRSESLQLSVELDVSEVAQKIREIFPDESVSVDASKDSLVVFGQASSKEVADRIVQVASTGSSKVVNLLTIPGPPPPGEVQLSVKFAEVDRAALNQFGVNFISPGTGSGPRSTVGTLGTEEFAPPTLTTASGTSPSTFNLSDLLNIFVFRPDIDLAAIIKALQQQNLLQVLAEPNLLTQMGKEASFLAGGEFPFPVVQATTGATAVTIQFKEFGVKLDFTPTQMPNGKIHLKVQPEVSSLDFSNALTISGFTIPALSTRRVDSEMDLNDGQSFAIAGLVNDQLTKTANKIPVLGDFPGLGRFFRSYSTNKSKTELLVVVTPRVVVPLSPGQALPGLTYPLPFLPSTVPESPNKGTHDAGSGAG